ncbi:MAG: Gfo/Idh/MocA family protein [Candidatus Sumerlaeia bacterium]
MARFKKASDIKVGVVGYGGAFNMGFKHLCMARDAGMTPVAVCEIDAERLAVAEKDFPGIETYKDLGEMLKNSAVDLVIIITPHNTHAPLALKCLKAGRHVVVEKPLAIKTSECDAMIREAEKRDLVISTFHNRHWDGCILEALEHIRKGEIGDVVRIECRMGNYGKPRDWWRSSKSISGGSLYDWGVHLLEYSLQILGDAKIEEVTGFVRKGLWQKDSVWKDDANEDEAQAVVRFSGDRLLTLRVSSIEMNNKPGRTEITGAKGAYIMDGQTYEIITHEKGQKVIRQGRNQADQQEKYYQNVADHLARDKKLIITGEWSRRPIHILDLAYQSADKGKAIKAKYE